MTQAIQGRIFNIQRFSIHDGPGIRTTVFMKGCPLKCAWCHNPESISSKNNLSFMPDKCIGCGYCFKACPQHAHSMVDDKHVLDRDKCVVCGKCAEECYAGALELVGRDATVEEVIKEVLADEPFYETSGGGMTLSGGEPLMQIEFTEALLKAAREKNLHCCLDTCGYVKFACFERVLPYVDIFLYDIKNTVDEVHRQNTGVSNEIIIENLRKLHDTGAKILVRAPLIPGCNSNGEHLEGLAQLVLSLPGLMGVELMPYHRLGTSKLERFGMDDPIGHEVEPPSDDDLDKWILTLRDRGVNVINKSKKAVS